MHDVNPIELTNGSVTIGGRPILRGIDLTVESGQFVALMGANGSGKSTLVRALVGLLAARRRRPADLRHARSRTYDEWSRVGFVPQRASAESGVPASVWEVVASGRLTHRRLFRPMSRADRAAVDRRDRGGRASQGKARDGISSLSGGQQQRALIARALAGEPDLFFLDEPTAGRRPAQPAGAGRRARAGCRPAAPPSCWSPTSSARWRRWSTASVVMRDGRIAYDGPPLGDHEVHAPQFGEAHGHHHHPTRGASTTTCPHVSAPLDGRHVTVDLFTLAFMQRALVAALFTGLAAPAVGTYLVQRRLALMGDGIGHVAVTGVALGLLTGTLPDLDGRSWSAPSAPC